MKRNGQAARLLAYLADHPLATSLDITLALGIVNVTGRVSDLRAAGHTIACRKRPDGRDGYVIVPQRVVTKGEQVGLAL